MAKEPVTLPTWWHGRTADEWKASLSSDIRALRVEAIWSLGETGAPTPEAVDAVRASLSPDAHADVAEAAAFVVRRWGPDAPGDLADRLLHARPWGELQVFALAAMGARVVPSLVAALASGVETTQRRALAALATLGREAETAADDVERLAREAGPHDVRTSAAWTVARLGPGGARHAIALLSSSDLDVADVARRALASVATVAVPLLREALRRATDDEVAVLADALAGMGPTAKAAVPELLEALRRKGPGRFSAADALVAIGPAAAPGLEALAKDPDPDIAAVAAHALERLEGR